jgi:hypothetical protein
MKNKQVFEDSSSVSAVEGKVVVKGPDGVDVALTPDAAAETSDLLWAGASQARAQQRRDTEIGKPGSSNGALVTERSLPEAPHCPDCA